LPPDDIRQIELRRLRELEKQAALYGPNTEPEILIEIQDLHFKYPNEPRGDQRRGTPDRTRAQSEFDYLLNTVAAALSRITHIEQRQSVADDDRQQLKGKLDQLIYGIGDLKRWVKLGGVAVAIALAIGFILAIVVF
jgi:hypothetical protein